MLTLSRDSGTPEIEQASAAELDQLGGVVAASGRIEQGLDQLGHVGHGG